MSDKLKLKDLILECLLEHKLKNAFKKLVTEAMSEIKVETEKTVSECVNELEKELKKIDSDYTLCKTDAGNYVFDGSPLNGISLKHIHGDRFDVTHIKDNSQRTKKLMMSVSEIKDFISSHVKTSNPSYVSAAHNKSVENSKPSEGKDEGKPKNSDESEGEDAELSPVKKLKKQSDHSVKGTKPKYTYPKQKNDSLTVKQRSKKSMSLDE